MTSPIAASPPDAPARKASIAVLFAIIALHQAGTGLVFSAIPVRLAADAAPAWVVGLVSTAWSAGFLFGCLVAPRWIGRIGARRSIAVFAGTNALAAALLTVGAGVVLWSASRGLAGLSTAVLFGVLETWLGSLTTTRTRGTVFGLYMVVNRILFMAGQLVLVWVDPRWSGLFFGAALAYLLAPLPALRLAATPPVMAPRAGASLLELPRRAPAAAAGVIAHGLLTTAGPSLFPIFGLAAGLTIERLALALAAIQFGGLVLQLPFMLLSDRIGRRSVMGLLGASTAAASVLFLTLPLGSLPVMLALAALWGGAPSVLYAVAAAHSNDIATDSQRMTWSSSLMLNWGLGAALGPLAASLAMDRFGPPALFAFTGLLGAVLVLFLSWRKLVRRRRAGHGRADDMVSRGPGCEKMGE